MKDNRRLYWVACQKCSDVLTSTDLAEAVRLYAVHILEVHGSYPHYPAAGSTPLESSS